MKMYKAKRHALNKLVIKQETIRHLRDSELHAVAGGSSEEGGCFTKRVLCTSLYVICDGDTSVNTFHPR
jgi:hypothetical protein